MLDFSFLPPSFLPPLKKLICSALRSPPPAALPRATPSALVFILSSPFSQTQIPGIGIPLCAAQCKRMFHTTRTPGEETGKDMYRHMKHTVVTGRFTQRCYLIRDALWTSAEIWELVDVSEPPWSWATKYTVYKRLCVCLSVLGLKKWWVRIHWVMISAVWPILSSFIGVLLSFGFISGLSGFSGKWSVSHLCLFFYPLPLFSYLLSSLSPPLLGCTGYFSVLLSGCWGRQFLAVPISLSGCLTLAESRER